MWGQKIAGATLATGKVAAMSAPARGRAFPALLRPGAIGRVELASRIILPAMDMNLCEDGEITEGEINHYERVARGGVAMVITGSGAVEYPHGATSTKQPDLSSDACIPGLRRMADAVHGAGSRLCIQLCHHGKSARLDMAASRDVLVPSMPEAAPDLSALADCTMRELGLLAAAAGGNAPTFRAATDEDLAVTTGAFAAAAVRAQTAGADAVEIHAAHGYLLSSFLSPAENRRTDRWGGSIENRARLTVEVIRAVREAVGSDLAVLVRLSGQEFGDDQALSVGDAVAIARLCEQAGADAIHVTGYGVNPFADFTEGPLPSAEGAYRTQTTAIQAAVNIPVIAVGRISPELADDMLSSGQCEFVSMGRQLLADPDLATKLGDGRREQVRPCINCYVCVEQNFFDRPPICAVNPALGRAEPDPAVAATARHVLVVGGGPAGMESARVAAERGHRVTLMEASGQLGGTAWVSQLTTPANGPLVAWLETEIERLGVEVLLSTPATAQTVRDLGPDVVVVATGAVRARPAVPGADLPHVSTGDDLRALLLGEDSDRWSAGLTGLSRAARMLRISSDPERLRSLTKRWMPLGRRIVVVGGGLVGLELSELLAWRSAKPHSRSRPTM